MPGFELLERDGLARLGRLDTPHGALATPALLPVVHPDPDRQPIAPAEMARRFGVRGVISSAYITWRTPPLRARAEREGIHGLLGYDGVVMTDSGAFQQHAYGAVEVTPEEIVAFQGLIRSDVTTVLDRFTEPEAPREEAEQSLLTTMDRARAARAAHSGLLAVPVQGGVHDELRARAAAEASEVGDVLAVGGVVPLLEQYRFVELARSLVAARPTLRPGRPVHLFGTGHPLTFAFAALFGVDLYDSSAYHKFARRGSLLFPEGTVELEDVREPICRCALCEVAPLAEVRGWAPSDRERHLAIHNLLTSLEEVGRVRQAIRDGTLWELAERRAVAHPALRAGLAEAKRHPEVFLPTEPESRRAFREIGPESLDRPAAFRFRNRVAALRVRRGPGRTVRRIPLRPEYLRHLPPRDRSGNDVPWDVDTPFGPVPLELTDLYPVGPYLGLEEFAAPSRAGTPSALRASAPDLPDRTEADLDLWTTRQIGRLLEWRYGAETAGRLAPGLSGVRSRRSGRLKTIVHEGSPMFVLGTDGVPRPTFRGGRLVAAAAPLGRERVVVAADAVPFVRGGRSLFARFAISADPSLVPGATALLVDEGDELLGVGRMLLAPHELATADRGVAVHVTAHAGGPERVDPDDDAEGAEAPPDGRPDDVPER